MIPHLMSCKDSDKVERGAILLKVEVARGMLTARRAPP